MKIYRSLDEFEKPAFAVVTLGTFDGVHIGHRKLIERMREIARKADGETVLLTFFPHPRIVLYGDQDLKLIHSLDEKIEALSETGIDHLIIYPFTKEFSRLSSTEFVKDILVGQIGTKKLVIGYNHHFGRNREGTFEHLSKLAPDLGFTLEEIPEQDVGPEAVSSTKIRNALLAGDVKKAADFLGKPFYLSGKVIAGDKIGRKIGFPTANIRVVEPYKLIPGDGVYAVLVKLNGNTYNGMMNIGYRPTVSGKSRIIEVNIFDFNLDIYGSSLTVTFIERIRKEIKYANIEELKTQLIIDRENTIKILS